MKLARGLLFVVVLASCSGAMESVPSTVVDAPTATVLDILPPVAVSEPRDVPPDTHPPPATTSEPVVCSESLASTPGANGAVLSDVDGDGIGDAVSVCGREDSEQWQLRVEYGSGCTAQVPFDRDLFFGIAPYVYSVFDIEGDGSMEIFLANGGGAHTEAIWLFDVQPCEIREIVHREDPDYGAYFLLDYGATSVGGLACSSGELRKFWAYRDALEGPFDVDVVTYALEGDALTLISHIEQNLSPEELAILYDPPCRQSG